MPGSGTATAPNMAHLALASLEILGKLNPLAKPLAPDMTRKARPGAAAAFALRARGFQA